MKTPLCEIFEKYGSDKCPSIFHSYSSVYYDILKDHKDSIKNILEIGIGNFRLMSPIVGSKYIAGASLRSWAEFFPNANVFGCDIDKTVLFSEPRINCYYTDQSKETELLKTISDIGVSEFDLIIDDGSHIVEHMLLSLKVLHKFLSTGGIYIIEDIQLKDLQLFTNQKVAENLRILKIHEGKSYWDSFVAYTR